MTFRRFLFWIHLIAGSIAGIVILIMSVTGILLAYKRQIVNWPDRSFQSQPSPNAQRLPLEQLLATVRQTQGRMPAAITVRAGLNAPVSFDFGRERTVFVNPYTGQILGEGSTRLRGFFSTVEDWHRWLAFGANNRSAGRAITGACNLAFLLLVLTGPILWWPKEWSWSNLKKILLFRAGPWGRARDWNWHNAAGFWCALPLLLIVTTGVIMSYPWANNLLYRMTGSDLPPQTQASSERARVAGLRGPAGDQGRGAEPAFEDLEKFLARASLQAPGWTTITLRLAASGAGPLIFSIDQGDGGRPDLRSQLTLDPATGKIVRWEPFSSYNRGRQLRAWARFTHTGEAAGLSGETLAAAASAGAAVLVFTGLSLGIRRLLAWKSRQVQPPV